MAPRVLGRVHMSGLRPTHLFAQLPVPIAIEARIGYALPVGGFASVDGPGAEGGPSFGVGGRVEVSPLIAVVASYSQTRFDCPKCEANILDSQMVLEGAEGGLRVTTPQPFVGASPWFQGALLYQTLAFSSAGDRMTSSSSLGFSATAGASFGIPVGAIGRLEFMPAVRYLFVPTTFDFSFAPEASTDVSGVGIEIGVAFRL